jgi:hypothetical protein
MKWLCGIRARLALKPKMSRPALIVAGIYFVIALGVILTEAMSPPSGGWITLKNMGAFLATFPVSAPLAMIGFQPDLDNKFVVASVLAGSTGLIYLVVSMIARLFTSR